MPKSSRLPSLEEFEKRLKARKGKAKQSLSGMEDILGELKTKMLALEAEPLRMVVAAMREMMESVEDSLQAAIEGQSDAFQASADAMSDMNAGLETLIRAVEMAPETISADVTAQVLPEVTKGAQRTVAAVQNEIRNIRVEVPKVDTSHMANGLAGMQSDLAKLTLSVERLANKGEPRLLNLTVTDRDEDGNIESVEIQATHTRH